MNSPDSHTAPAPRLSVLLAGVGLLVLAVVLIAVLLPGQSADRDTPSSIKPVATLARFAHAGNGVAVAFSPDGTTLAVGSGERVGLWDVADRRQRTRLISTSNENVAGLAFRSDGRYPATVSYDGRTRLWKVP
ncbi:hypothetical protein [Streptomyces cuspidosporus]|uniref:WD40 repeat domain-containing protein n=1 Tax=Streptomyces cuspidosporus TaxID=66882 RepID=UPI0031FDABB6